MRDYIDIEASLARGHGAAGWIAAVVLPLLGACQAGGEGAGGDDALSVSRGTRAQSKGVPCEEAAFGAECDGLFPHAVGDCVDGICVLGDCQMFFLDLNGVSEDGCELFCQPLAQQDGCNGVDDDCDGQTDEDVNLARDPLNCGACGAVCAVPHATPICPEGRCRFKQCDEGFFDADADPSNGCEYFCTRLSEDDPCNGLDDNCDGRTDEADAVPCNPCDPAIEGEKGNPVGTVCALAMGICEAGRWTCVDDGSKVLGLQCCSEQATEGPCISPRGPTVEGCDGLDNDCDGLTDEGLPTAGVLCGNDLGVCEAGELQCVCEDAAPDDCAITCVGATEGTYEVCNAQDDDCDGLTDEELPIGEACTNAPGGTPTGGCDQGFLECRLGQWICNASVPTLELCDGVDNNCDGLTDENIDILCPEGRVCVSGECVTECLGQDNSCSNGMVCREVPDADLRMVRVCLTDVCDSDSDEALPCATNPYWCDEGEEPLCKCSVVQKKCVTICRDIPCPAGTACVPGIGQCRAVGDGCYSEGCPEGQICREGRCVTDPCIGVMCGEGTYCNNAGTCVGYCERMSCPVMCKEGSCVDPCGGVICGAGEVCDIESGICESIGACDQVSCEGFPENKSYITLTTNIDEPRRKVRQPGKPALYGLHGLHG